MQVGAPAPGGADVAGGAGDEAVGGVDLCRAGEAEVLGADTDVDLDADVGADDRGFGELVHPATSRTAPTVAAAAHRVAIS